MTKVFGLAAADPSGSIPQPTSQGRSVAHAMGVPEALQIRCGNWIFHGLQSLELGLSSLNVDSEHLSCTADANRLELAKHLRMIEPELTA